MLILRFNPDLLATFAANLPNLESLRLGCMSISIPIILSTAIPSQNSLATMQVCTPSPFQLFQLLYIINVTEFVKDVDKALLSQWRLQALDIFLWNDIVLGDYPQDENYSYKLELMNALPNVKIFCGLSREQYLARGNSVKMKDFIYRIQPISSS